MSNNGDPRSVLDPLARDVRWHLEPTITQSICYTVTRLTLTYQNLRPLPLFIGKLMSTLGPSWDEGQGLSLIVDSDRNVTIWGHIRGWISHVWHRLLALIGLEKGLGIL